jgi:acyl-CoA thioester hydrolase
MAKHPLVAVPATPFTWTVRVYYEDTDTGGIVYYANYLKFFERARTEWLRAVGFEQQRMAAELGLQFVVAQVQCDYSRPARLDELIEIDVRIAQLARVYVVFEQDARRGTELLASARVKAACVDTHRLIPKAMPPAMRTAFASLPSAPAS